MSRPIAFGLAFLIFFSVDTGAQAPSSPTREELSGRLEELSRQFDQMKSDFQARITELEGQILRLSAASPSPSDRETVSQPSPLTAGQRALQALNPEISVTGDVTARYADPNPEGEFNRLNFDGFEMSIQHPLDPYSTAKFFVTLEDGEFDLEEGYLSWEALPGSLGLKVGRFHTDFGRLNRYHKHALPWADRDLPTRSFFGDEGLVGDGIALSWLPPRLPWAHTNEVFFEVVNNGNDRAFSGKGFGDPIYLARLLNYYDLNDSSYLEWGLSSATSHWDLDEQYRSTVLSLDLGYKWAPLARAAYRSLEIRSELFYNARENWPAGDLFGLYAYGEYQISRRWFGGLRYQFAESREQRKGRQWGLAPFVSFWQSEWVRIRAQYDFLNNNLEENENRFFLQFTWALGPHKHEAY